MFIEIVEYDKHVSSTSFVNKMKCEKWNKINMVAKLRTTEQFIFQNVKLQLSRNITF